MMTTTPESIAEHILRSDIEGKRRYDSACVRRLLPRSLPFVTPWGKRSSACDSVPPEQPSSKRTNRAQRVDSDRSGP
jgi:hypothetical protein